MNEANTYKEEDVILKMHVKRESLILGFLVNLVKPTDVISNI